jgi:hypothetical protein
MTPMPATLPMSSTARASSSLVAKLFDMLVSPGEVFDEVLAAPPRLANWLLPTLLVAVTSLFLLRAVSNETASTSGQSQPLNPQLSTLNPPVAQPEPGSADWQRVSALATCVGAFAGSFWSAFLLWLIGRTFLRTRFSYLKALEVVALTSIIVALGAIITALLIAASGDPATRPALSLFARHLSAASPVRQLLDTLNFFHLWSTTVLAIGLSRLSGVSFKECAFWVFGYWVVVRLALIVLG